MKYRTWASLVVAALVPMIMGAAAIGGPGMGVVFDPAAKVLRPIFGTPGAAVFGDPLNTDVSLSRATVSPSQDYAIGTAGEAQSVVVLDFSRSPIASAPVAGASAAPDEIAVSPAGRAAALYYKDRNQILIVTGLPAHAKVSTELMLSAVATPVVLAVGDDGRTVLAGTGHSVVLVTANGEVPILSNLGQAAAIVVFNSTGPGSLQRPVRALWGDRNIPSPTVVSRVTALVADASQNRVLRVNDVTGNVNVDILAGAAEGISSPVALAVSADGSRVLVANGKSGIVSILNLQGELAQKIACHCALTGLGRLTGGDVFRLTDPSDRPVWVLDASVKTPQVVFVPAKLDPSAK